MRLLIAALLAGSAWGQFFPFPGPGLPAVAASATYTTVHHTTAAGCGSGASCALTITQPTAANLLVFVAFGNNGGGGITPSAPTSTPSAGTWAACPNTTQAVLNGASSAFVLLACYYSLSAAASGPTTLTWNWSGIITGTTVELVEVHRSSGSWTYDTSNSTADTSCTTCAGQALTLTGTDYVIQFAGGIATSGHNLSAISGSYTDFTDFANFGSTFTGGGVAGANGIASGAAPNWTLSTADVLPVGAIAFK